MSVYYTNGINEKRISDINDVPDGWYKGRIKSTITTAGCMWINNGEVEFFIKNNEAIPNGFVKGRIKSHLNSKKQSDTMKLKGYHHYTNGVKDCFISEQEQIPEGFVLGRPNMSKEQKLKLSASHVGKHHTDEAKQKISEHSNNNRDKAYQTIIDKYGSLTDYYHFLMEKSNDTKSKRKTFNTSKVEDNFYLDLVEKFGKDDVYRNYKCDRYPYRCDFYIKSLDKFIELNAHWTHGFQPYVETDKICQEQLKIWQEKAKTSQFYQNAIQTWTIRDVEKLNCAKQQGLNYEVIY